MKSTLIIGGARSGKSIYAQETAIKAAVPVLFVATAEAGDEDMRIRIEAHRRSRPADWATLEATTHIGSQITKNIGEAKLVIVDCITLLVNNIFMQYDDTTDADIAEKGIMAEIEELIDCMDRTEADFIIVSNETGLGLVPAAAELGVTEAIPTSWEILISNRSCPEYSMVPSTSTLTSCMPRGVSGGISMVVIIAFPRGSTRP